MREEIYNKDGNKLDLYGKVDGLHYFSSDSKKTAIKLIYVLASKAKPRSTICLPAMASGNITFRPTTPRPPAIRRGPVWHSPVSAGDYGSFDYGRNYGVLYDVEGWTDMLPEFGGDSYTYADNFMAGRANGVATYRNSDFFGLGGGS